jgi:PsbP
MILVIPDFGQLRKIKVQTNIYFDMKKILIPSFVILTSLSFCSYAQQTKSIGDYKNRYSIQVPTYWDRTKDNKSGANVVSFYDTTSNKGFLIIICSMDLESLNVTFKQNVKTLKDKLKNFKVIKESDENQNGVPSKCLEFSFESKNGSDNKGKEILLMQGGCLYTIQYVLPASNYDSDKDTFNKIVTTFKLN